MPRRQNFSRWPCVQSRRQFLVQSAAGFGAAVLFAPALTCAQQSAPSSPQVANPVTPRPLAPADDQLLDEISKASAQFFFEQSHPETGLTKDRSSAEGNDSRDVASIAATGFSLTALCIANQRGWSDPQRILEQARSTLRFAWNKIPHEHGFFFHFLNIRSGARVLASEVSSIDTAIFLCGALACKAYFNDDEIRDLATKLYERMDFAWLLRGQKLASQGWTPEHQFIGSSWDTYSELMMLYLLGLGSPTHPLAPEVWDDWGRPIFDFYGVRFIGAYAPLFAHQYSHAWFDFRGKRDKFANYFTNSILATRVHKQWCLDLAHQFPDYSEDLWGVTASDSPHGYTIWGGPPPMGHADGSIVPCAAGGSLPFLPQETIRVLHTVREKFGEKAWRKYGFVDAFNPLTNWYNADVLGIDVGITLLMAENVRTGFVWEQFMKNQEAQRGMQIAGFQMEGKEKPPANSPGAGFPFWPG
ncbi:MAG: glucoamylase family protein [Candidatus Acidiferrum sp.]|jgi:hypothetical protein